MGAWGQMPMAAMARRNPAMAAGGPAMPPTAAPGGLPGSYWAGVYGGAPPSGGPAPMPVAPQPTPYGPSGGGPVPPQMAMRAAPIPGQFGGVPMPDQMAPGPAQMATPPPTASSVSPGLSPAMDPQSRLRMLQGMGNRPISPFAPPSPAYRAPYSPGAMALRRLNPIGPPTGAGPVQM